MMVVLNICKKSNDSDSLIFCCTSMCNMFFSSDDSHDAKPKRSGGK